MKLVKTKKVVILPFKEGIDDLEFEIETKEILSSSSKKPVWNTEYVQCTVLRALFILCLNLKLMANLLLTMLAD